MGPVIYVWALSLLQDKTAAVWGVLGGYARHILRKRKHSSIWSFVPKGTNIHRAAYNLFQCWESEGSEEGQLLASYLGYFLADLKMRPLQEGWGEPGGGRG